MNHPRNNYFNHKLGAKSNARLPKSIRNQTRPISTTESPPPPTKKAGRDIPRPLSYIESNPRIRGSRCISSSQRLQEERPCRLPRNLSSKVEMICETATAVAFYDGYPVSKGHTLIIPKRHTSSYFDLTTPEQRALWLMVNHCKKILEDRFHPNGFNVGINVNEAAGQIRIQKMMSQRD